MLSQRMDAAASPERQIMASAASPSTEEDSKFWGETSSRVQNPELDSELESLRKELIMDRIDAEKEERQYWDDRDRKVPAGPAGSAPSDPSALRKRSNEEMKKIYEEERRQATELRAAGRQAMELRSAAELRAAAAADTAAADAAADANLVEQAAVPTEKKGFFSKLFGRGNRGGKHTHRRKKSKSALSRKNFKRYSVKGKRRNLRKSRR
jgi:hypothetical protein